MTVKEQLNTLKDNWLILLLLIIAVGLLAARGLFGGGGHLQATDQSFYRGAESAYYPGYDGGFAPGEEERVIERSATLRQETERGGFDEAVSEAKSILSSTQSIILSENVNRYGREGHEYRQGSYEVKVPVPEYEGTLARLKDVAKVTSYSEHEKDVTARALTLEDQLSTEKGRLARYEALREKATEVEDQLLLVDRIYEQERRIALLEERKDDLDARVEYATLSITLTEERSDYEDVSFVGFPALVKTVVGSAKALLYFLAAVLPWALIGLIIWLIAKKRR